LNIPDTVGYGIPWIRGTDPARPQGSGRELRLSTHCHNDLGLATANTLAGVQGGARQVEVCVNGLGERAGNAALEEVVMAIRIRPDQFPDVTTASVRGAGPRLAPRGPADGYPVQYNKAIVGRNAFATSRVFTSTACWRSHHYEIIEAASVGRSVDRSCSASTRDAILRRYPGEDGIHVQGDGLNQAFNRFKEFADRKVEITEADLEAIVAEELGHDLLEGFQLESLEVSGGTVACPARVVVSRPATSRKPRPRETA